MAYDTEDQLAAPSIKRLIVPFNPGAAPMATMQPVMTDGSLPRLSASPAPDNISVVPTAREIARGNTQRDLGELRRIGDTGSGISQIKNPFGRTLARIGEGVETALFPQFARLTPGTEANRQRLLNQSQQRLSNDLGVEQQQAQNENLNLQPQFKQAQLENATLKLQNQQDHWNDQTEIAKQKAENLLRGQGYKHDAQGNLVPLDYEELSPQQQGVIDAKKAQADYAKAQAEYEKSKGDPNSFVGQQALAKMQHAKNLEAIAYQKIGLQAQGLGLQRERMDLAEDKQYNPQPTGQERKTADLATSAGHYVDVMREVRQKHPEFFGPGAGRSMQFQAWLGSQDPDAQRYLAAANVAKDHLTAVFGARSKYALEGTGTLFDPKMNNEAFDAEYGDLKSSIDGFKKAGTPHGRGGRISTTSYAQTASGPSGHKIGSNDGGNTWYDIATGKKVQ